MQITKKRKATTLTELLIVLTIIGLISALTIPGLRKHSQRTEMAQLLKKAYLSLNLSVDKALAERPEDDMTKWDFSSNAVVFDNYFRPYLNIMRICEKNDTKCFANNYTTLSGTGGNDVSSYAVSALLGDGIAVQVCECNVNTCDIHVDVNGPNPPNVVDADYFELVLDKAQQKILPKPTSGGNYRVQQIIEDGWKINYW